MDIMKDTELCWVSKAMLYYWGNVTEDKARYTYILIPPPPHALELNIIFYHLMKHKMNSVYNQKPLTKSHSHCLLCITCSRVDVLLPA